MTDWRSGDDPARGGQASGQGGYSGGYQGGYQAGEYAQDPNPQPYTGPYGQQYGPQPPANPYGAAPYGQPPYGYGGYGTGGYGTGGYVAPADRRPGTLTSSAVLGYVTGGLLIIAGIICFFGASTLHSFNDDFGSTDTHHYTTQFVLAGLANLVAAGLLIAGSVSMSGRNANGRVMYMVGGGITIVASVYWIAAWATKDELGGLLFWALMFAALVIVGASLAFSSGPNRWLASSGSRAH